MEFMARVLVNTFKWLLLHLVMAVYFPIILFGYFWRWACLCCNSGQKYAMKHRNWLNDREW